MTAVTAVETAALTAVNAGQATPVEFAHGQWWLGGWWVRAVDAANAARDRAAS